MLVLHSPRRRAPDQDAGAASLSSVTLRFRLLAKPPSPSRLAAHGGDHVRVGVQGRGDVGVAQELGHQLRVRVAGEQEGSGGVAQVVEGNPR